MKYVKELVFAGLLALGAIALPVLVPVEAAAQADELLQGADATGQEGGSTVEEGITGVVNVLLFLLGAVAVIAIIIGGVLYAVSAGDSSKAKTAKDTILYAVIGLIVAILAYAIVNFIVTNFAE